MWGLTVPVQLVHPQPISASTLIQIYARLRSPKKPRLKVWQCTRVAFWGSGRCTMCVVTMLLHKCCRNVSNKIIICIPCSDSLPQCHYCVIWTLHNMSFSCKYTHTGIFAVETSKSFNCRMSWLLHVWWLGDVTLNGCSDMCTIC